MPISRQYSILSDFENLMMGTCMEGRNSNGEKNRKKPSHYKVLVVDDEELITKLIATLLSKEGHQCEAASNGFEALNKIKQNRFDAVITDIVIPGMDGISLTKQISSLYPNLPIMLITGYDEKYSAEAAITPGAWDLIVKPFSTDEFSLRFSKMMGDHEILCQKEAKQDEMIPHLNRDSTEEIQRLEMEMENLKSRLCSLYAGLGL